MLFAVVLLVVVAILANIGPLTRYQDVRARLDKATAKVSELQTQKAELQRQVAKLSEAAYLETLARSQLTFVRPGEELYILTQPQDGSATAASAGSTAGAGESSAAAESGVPATGAHTAVTDDPETSLEAEGRTPTVDGDSVSAGGLGLQATDMSEANHRPGLLERIVSAIRDLF